MTIATYYISTEPKGIATIYSLYACEIKGPYQASMLANTKIIPEVIPVDLLLLHVETGVIKEITYDEYEECRWWS